MTQSSFLLRLPPKQMKDLKSLALKRGISVNALCAKLLTTPTTPLDLITKIKKHFPSSIGVILFGSVARNESTDASDMDLLVVLESSQKLTRSLYDDWDRVFSSREEAPLSPHFVLFPKDFSQIGSLWLEVAMDGKVLCENDHRLTALLGQLRRYILENNFKIKTTGTHRYWIKPYEK